MNSFIRTIKIKNFKSINELKLDGFKRINLFIGKPNVGKSNILEALSVFTFSFFENHSSLLFNDLIRAENLLDIFHQNNFNESFTVAIEDKNTHYFSTVKYLDDKEKFLLKKGNEHLRENESKDLEDIKVKKLIDNDWDGLICKSAFAKDKSSLGRINFFDIIFKHNFKQGTAGGKGEKVSHIKRYIFKKGFQFENVRSKYLFPPFGTNLLHVLEFQPELREIFASWFEQYNLKLVFDRTSNSIRVQKEIGKNEVFSLPYSSIADTLQRIIFYKTAIASNKNSVLIFEEPEAHAYPPYIAEFTQEVIHSETNQFFMATHSPIIVDDFLTNAIDDLAIFMVDFKDGQTVVKGLSREEIHDVYKYGVDLFFNNESYPVA